MQTVLLDSLWSDMVLPVVMSVRGEECRLPAVLVPLTGEQGVGHWHRRGGGTGPGRPLQKES